MKAVWLKHDLRLEDNPAFFAALNGSDKLPMIIITNEDQIGQVRLTDRRKNHEAKLFEDVRARITTAGGNAFHIDGQAASILETIKAHNITSVHACVQIGDNISYQRDRAVKQELLQNNVSYAEHALDGVARSDSKTDTPSVTTAKSLAPLTYTAQPPALRALRHYLAHLPTANYRRDMWTPGPDATASSRLSINMACGAIGSERVLHEVRLALASVHPRDRKPYNEFAARIGWRNSFLSLFEQNIQAFPWDRMRHERFDDASKMTSWLQGETGYPLVDAAMRDLTTNGWINFRLRQLLASFALDLLDLDLHLTGIALGELFDDYCPGIHWPQIGLQAGMMRSRGPRVLNPTKQMIELDPQGAYCKQWLPWLKETDTARIHEPWKSSKYSGPQPILDYMTAAREARDRHPKILE